MGHAAYGFDITPDARVVVDAVANDDPTVVAEACRGMALMTAGRAVAMPLPRLCMDDGLLSTNAEGMTPPEPAPGDILLSGSSSAMTCAQVAAHRALDRPRLANRGTVVAGKEVEAACNGIEELEDTGRLAMPTRGLWQRGLSPMQVAAPVTKFDVEWGD